MTPPITTIDTDSEDGSWAETLASPSCKIAVSHHRQIGSAAADNQGGGLCVSTKGVDA